MWQWWSDKCPSPLEVGYPEWEPCSFLPTILLAPVLLNNSILITSVATGWDWWLFTLGRWGFSPSPSFQEQVVPLMSLTSWVSVASRKEGSNLEKTGPGEHFLDVPLT